MESKILEKESKKEEGFIIKGLKEEEKAGFEMKDGDKKEIESIKRIENIEQLDNIVQIENKVQLERIEYEDQISTIEQIVNIEPILDLNQIVDVEQILDIEQILDLKQRTGVSKVIEVKEVISEFVNTNEIENAIENANEIENTNEIENISKIENESVNQKGVYGEESQPKPMKSLPKGITKRSDGRYQATYYHMGVRHYLYDMDLERITKRLRDIQYEMEHGIYCKPEKIRLNDWFEVWIKEYKELMVKKGTLENYRRNYNCYIRPYIGNMYVREIRVEHLQKLYNDLVRKGYSISTLRVSRGVLSGMFNQLVKNDIILKNPVTFVVFPKEKKRKMKRVLSREEQKAFLIYAEESDYRDLYRLALSTGLRIGELMALKWKDINFELETLTVNGNMKYFKDTGFYIDTPKSLASFRTIPLLPDIVKMLKKRKRRQAEERIKAGERWKKKPGLDHLVFTDPLKPGEPVRKRTIAYDLDRIVAMMNGWSEMQITKKKGQEMLKGRLEVERITPHTLRHTFATRALENGIPPKVVQELLGHSSIKMTMDIYTHVLPQTKKEEILKLQGLV